MALLSRNRFPNKDNSGTWQVWHTTLGLMATLAMPLGLTLPLAAQESPSLSSSAPAPNPASPTPATTEAMPQRHKLGPLDISVNWRVRVEGWNWFQANSGENDYAFTHSLLRIAIGQQTEHLDWRVEVAQDSILALPSTAVVAAPQGQLGLGGTYFAANGNSTSIASGFVKQAYLTFKHAGPVKVQLGRFTFLDGAELIPKDKFLATVAQTRVSQRLIGDFGWSAVGRSLDGGRATIDWGGNDFTFIAARPTRGVYQVDGMGELNVNLFYGAYSHVLTAKRYHARMRAFGIGYLDDRDAVLKTDNRPTAVRAADHHNIQIGTYGGELLQTFAVSQNNHVDVILWGVLQNGSWGTQTQSASAFITEAGWQADSLLLNPWFSAGVSRGSGDKNPNDSTHGTFFQILPTPRPYARFPFFDMENNEDFYGDVVLKPARKLSLRSEVHALRLANAADLWYLGGGAFQPRTFGYTGRPSGGSRSLANMWDVSADYQIMRPLGITVYYGHAWGKSVIENLYPKNPNGQFAYLETNLRF